jgi:hypothetical protein
MQSYRHFQTLAWTYHSADDLFYGGAAATGLNFDYLNRVPPFIVKPEDVCKRLALRHFAEVEKTRFGGHLTKQLVGRLEEGTNRNSRS